MQSFVTVLLFRDYSRLLHRSRLRRIFGIFVSGSRPIVFRNDKEIMLKISLWRLQSINGNVMFHLHRRSIRAAIFFIGNPARDYSAIICIRLQHIHYGINDIVRFKNDACVRVCFRLRKEKEHPGRLQKKVSDQKNMNTIRPYWAHNNIFR